MLCGGGKGGDGGSGCVHKDGGALKQVSVLCVACHTVAGVTALCVF